MKAAIRGSIFLLLMALLVYLLSVHGESTERPAESLSPAGANQSVRDELASMAEDAGEELQLLRRASSDTDSGTSGAIDTDRAAVTTGAKRSATRTSMAGGNPQRTGFYSVSAPLTKPSALWETSFGEGVNFPATAVAVDGIGRIFASHGKNDSDWFSAYTPQGKRLWSYGPIDARRSLAAPAVLPNGTVVQKIRTGEVTAFAVESGELLWAVNTGINANSSVLVDSNGDIYIAAKTESGMIKIDGDTGRVLWPSTGVDPESTFMTSVSSTMSNDERAVYCAGRAGPEQPYDVFAVDADTGAVRWSFRPEAAEKFLEGNWGSPVVGPDGTIYLQDAWSGSLYALRDQGVAATELWKYDPMATGIVHRFEERETNVYLNEAILSAHEAPRLVATDGDAIYMGAFGFPASVHAVSMDGSSLWHTTLDEDVSIGSPVVTPAAVYVIGCGDENVAGNNALYCLDRNTGEILWQVPVARMHGDTGESIALGADGTIYLASDSITGTHSVLRAWR